MKTRTIKFTNNFHNTESSVRIPEHIFPCKLGYMLNVGQVKRIKHQLCPSSDCTCGGNLGERGKQEVIIEPQIDGRVLISKS